MCDCIVCTSVLCFLITKIKFSNYKSYIVFNDNPITKLAKSRYERESSSLIEAALCILTVHALCTLSHGQSCSAVWSDT